MYAMRGAAANVEKKEEKKPNHEVWKAAAWKGYKRCGRVGSTHSRTREKLGLGSRRVGKQVVAAQGMAWAQGASAWRLRCAPRM